MIEIPLFNKYQNRLLVDKEKINLANAKLATKEIENDIVKNAQRLVYDFIAAKQKYLLQSASLEQGKLSYSPYEERHKLGYITALELITAKDQVNAEQVKATRAKYDMYFKYKLIELLMKM